MFACLYKSRSYYSHATCYAVVDQHPVDVITLDVYPSGISSYEMYEDDGISMDYQKDWFIDPLLTAGSLMVAGRLLQDKTGREVQTCRHTYLVKAYLQNARNL